MKLRIVGALLACAAAPALAGPPYLTDDPVPTDTGHWEIYAFGAGEGHRSSLDADAGFDLNYGAVKGVQLTTTVPLSFSHEAEDGWRSGTGDIELAVKYRFVNDEKSGFSAAIFPRAILPTSGIEEEGKTRLLLPLWLEKDFAGGTSVFGGGGYELNPGSGNRNFGQGAVALTHQLNGKLSIGTELAWQQPDQAGGTNQIRLGVGSIVKLSDQYALLFSGGPTWADYRTSYRFYGAVGLFF